MLGMKTVSPQEADACLNAMPVQCMQGVQKACECVDHINLTVIAAHAA